MPESKPANSKKQVAKRRLCSLYENEDGGSSFLWKIRYLLSVNVASYHRRLHFTEKLVLICEIRKFICEISRRISKDYACIWDPYKNVQDIIN
jgi:hypothetical protein